MEGNVLKKLILILLFLGFYVNACEAQEKIDVFSLAAKGTPEELRAAVMKGADFNVKRSMSEFYDNEIDEAELDKIDSLFFYDETPLHHAATYNHNPDSIKFLISLGLDVNAEASDGGSSGNTGTPLSCAIINRNLDAVKVLLEGGANPNSQICNYALSGGYFHLIAMDYKNHPAEAQFIIDALIKASGDVNSHEELSSEELASLLEYEEEFIKYRKYREERFIKYRIIFLPRSQWTSDIPVDNMRDFSNATRGNLLSTLTPLMYAVLYDNPDIVNIMLDVNADVGIRSAEGKNAIDYALELPENSRLKKSQTFERLKAAIITSPKLDVALQNASAAQIEKMVAEKKVPAYVRDKGTFFYDPKLSKIIIIGYDVRLRSQPNTKANILGKENKEMWGAIDYLGEWTHPDGSKWLVGLYDDGSKNSDAVSEKDKRIVWVSAKFAKPVTNEQYKLSQADFIKICKSGSVEMLHKVMKRYNISPNDIIDGGYTLLTIAARHSSNANIINELIRLGADINYHVQVPENEKQIVIINREDENDTSHAMDIFNKLPAEKQRIFYNSCPYITQAVFEGRPDIVEILLKAGADVNIRNMENKTAFDYLKDSKLPFHKKWVNLPVYNLLCNASQTGKFESLEEQDGQKLATTHFSHIPKRYIVTDQLTLVLKDDQDYSKVLDRPYGGWLLIPYTTTDIDDSIPTKYILAYGDVIEGYPFHDEYSGKLIRIVKDKATIGIANLSAFRPMPNYESFSPVRPYQLEKELIPYLLPGKYPVSNYSHFVLPRGTVIMAEGRTKDEKGDFWILCSFMTKDFSSFYSSEAHWVSEYYLLRHAGSDHRYAWLPEKHLVDLMNSIPDLSRVDSANLPAHINDNARDYLTKNGFYIDPSPIFREYITEDDLVQCYVSASDNTPKFITADLPLHALHLYFEYAIKQAEEDFMLPRTNDFITAMREAFMKLPKETSELEQRARLNIANFLNLAQYLLTGKDNLGMMKDFAKMIINAEGWGENPFTERQENFGLYAPRGHYSLNDSLKAYFRTTYLLGTIWPLDSETGAASVLILNKLLDDPNVAKHWHALYDPMKYLFGTSNVNSYEDLSIALKSFSLSDLGNISRVHALMEALDKAGKESTLRKPAGMLSPSGKKFTLLPRRVTFDALVLNTLTFPETGTPNKQRTLPDPLDIMAVLGSEQAKEEVKRYANFRNYDANLNKLAEIWPSYADSDDGANVYTSVLSALRSYFNSKDSTQFFANSSAWGYKKLTTAGAVLTELNHDALFYGERYAIGEPLDFYAWVAGPFEQPIPKGYIEPVPELYSTLGIVAQRLKISLSSIIQEGEYGPKIQERLQKFSENMDVLSAIAYRAVNDSMTYDDFMVIHNFKLPSVLPDGADDMPEKLTVAFVMYDDDFAKELRMALVVDTTSYFKENLAKRETPTLYTATGTPRKIYVYVNDRSGGWRLTEGYMYSYYTFEQSAMGNMNDDKWRAIVYDEKAHEELTKLLPYWHDKLH